MPSLPKIENLAGSINRRLENLMAVITPLSVVIGFCLPRVFIHLRPFVPLLFGVMTFSGALKLRAHEFGAVVKRPAPVFLFFAAAHAAMPLLALAAASLCFENKDIVTGFVLLFCGPTAVSGIIWTAMYGGDNALCLTLILLDTMLAPLAVPGGVLVLMGAKTAMDVGGIALSLLYMVVIPTILGVAVNEASRGKVPAKVCPYVDPAAKICLMLVIMANVSAIAPQIRLGEPLVYAEAALCIALSAAGFLLSKGAAVLGRCGNEKSVTLFFSGGLRNFSAITTIAVAFFPEDAALPALLSIVFQQAIAAVMGKLMIKTRRT
jgi:predicted Na+-dependent transporter